MTGARRLTPLPFDYLDEPRVRERAVENYAHATYAEILRPDTYVGRRAAVCVAGPSLPLQLDAIRRSGDFLIGVNSAAPYLAAEGVPVDAAATIDESDRLLDDWRRPVAAPHFLPVSVAPRVVRHLRARRRAVRFFHSVHKSPYLVWGPAAQDVYGAGSAAGIPALCLDLGFSRVTVYGADGWYGADGTAHATTSHDCHGQRLVGVLGRRTVHTSEQMLRNAFALAHLRRTHPRRVRLAGDTLAGCLARMTPDALNRVASFPDGLLQSEVFAPDLLAPERLHVVRLFDPVTGWPTTVRITLAEPYSLDHLNALAELAKMPRDALTNATLLWHVVYAVSPCLRGWENVTEHGRALEWSPANARRLLAHLPLFLLWVAQEVVRLAARHAEEARAASAARKKRVTCAGASRKPSAPAR